MLYAILSWAVFGLIIGAAARMIYPGRQSMGLMMTIILGIVGAFVGGSISAVIFRGATLGLHPVGLLMSVLGAVLVLFAYTWLENSPPSKP